MRDFVSHIHFVGVGGAGMSGIAQVLVNQNYRVSGSDLNESDTTASLRAAGVRVFVGHDTSHVAGADVVVTSTAVPQDNPEVAAAQALKIPVIPRAEMLGELMRFSRGTAVAGTHGKTTTTGMVASVLAAGGIDPTIVVGGVVNSINSTARLGRSEHLVAEADESDASFLHLQPQIAVVTNIDSDHMETYGGDFDRLRQTYIDFLHNLPFYGLAVLFADDPVVAEIAQTLQRRVLTYGTDANAHVRANNIRQDGLVMMFDLLLPAASRAVAVRLPMPGEHNVCNALAAAAVGDALGVPAEKIAEGIASYSGTGRRFELLGNIRVDGGEALVVDDYAHHPRELTATLSAAQGAWPDRRIVVVFQPHRFSRTRDLLDDFGVALQHQSPLLVTDVYPAGEAPISGADGRAICRVVRARGQVEPIFVPLLDQLEEAIDAIVQPGDVILTLGAGDIGRHVRQLVSQRQVDGHATVRQLHGTSELASSATTSLTPLNKNIGSVSRVKPRDGDSK